MRGDQLAEVFVGGDHDDLVESLGLGPMGGGANHIIGFIAFACDDGDVEGGDDATDVGQPHLYGFGHGFAIGFVFLVHLVAESGFLQVESHSHVCRLQFLDEVVERGGETQHSRGVDALGISAVGAAEGVVGAIDHRHAVEENKLFHQGRGSAVSSSYSLRLRSILQARYTALRNDCSEALSLPAMSKAVPWAGDVRT